jgi:hypothetical protein
LAVSLITLGRRTTALASANGLRLVTLNRRHFEPLTISGLTAAAAIASAHSASA